MGDEVVDDDGKMVWVNIVRKYSKVIFYVLFKISRDCLNILLKSRHSALFVLKFTKSQIWIRVTESIKAHGKGDCVTVGTNIYWRNVYLFTDQAKDSGTGPRAPVVRQNLHTCLRGAALD